MIKQSVFRRLRSQSGLKPSDPKAKVLNLSTGVHNTHDGDICKPKEVFKTIL